MRARMIIPRCVWTITAASCATANGFVSSTSGYAREKAVRWWRARNAVTLSPAMSIMRLLALTSFAPPARIQVEPEGQFMRIVNVEFVERESAPLRRYQVERGIRVRGEASPSHQIIVQRKAGRVTALPALN